MVRISRQTENLFLTLSGSGAPGLVGVGARIRDRLSTIPEMRMEFFSKDSTFDPRDILGTTITLEAENKFKFSGIVISVEELEGEDGGDLFSAEIRPWPWLMTIGSENRVFQGMSTIEIVKEVFQVAGFTDVTDKTSDTYEAREYCVQYGESNFAFISRLMEEDGIYYYFDHSGTMEKIVLCDSISAHADGGTVNFTMGNRVGEKQAQPDTVFEWTENGKVVTGKVALFDYDMTLPNADLKVQSVQGSGSHSNNSVERYRATGHYKVAEKGEAQARKELEGYASDSARAKGSANTPIITTGAVFTLNHDERTAANGAYLVLGCTHYLLFEAGYKDASTKAFRRHVEHIDFPADMALFETEFEVQRISVQFRPRKVTPWPEVPSLLTARVTGPDGDEICTDEYGRIKVIFPWDRLGKAKETSSCWVRSVLPWTGKDWGWQSIPRIGMEVIIQFERGNIDRPYCTGMVYNGVNKPPYPLPGEMTKTGIRTNSSKGGGGFHELTFDDKKGEEKIFFQSEKDYQQLIKNNATITIGMETKDPGDLKQTIYHDKIETLKTGNHTFTVESGSEVVKISKDQTIDVGNDETETVGNDLSLTIGNNQSETIGKNQSEMVGGSSAISVSKNQSVTIGKSLTIEAGTSITLKVGESSIKITGTAIEIKSTQIKINGKMVAIEGAMMTEVKGNIVKVGAAGILTLKGSLTKIN